MAAMQQQQQQLQQSSHNSHAYNNLTAIKYTILNKIKLNKATYVCLSTE